ncbi:MAG: AAA family ATPase, partial [Alphaproteobacteria bacterium]
MQFNRLKLSGFKSFVEPTELLIETGLTGIVGPNGCGKSNLVEALCWVMGETSAKKMRGGEMDDVIFAGTTHRPARNVAEVVLALDNSDRQAPAIFNEHIDIEVSRRIDRGSGSNYRVNGREVRARDVQLLFADAASGARSTALVSQGQIGALIGAKPTERRHLLEEAAGITGLHSRRHEAELRLRAAETNLDRLEDVIATLEAQMQALKRQSRQAARYRSLSGRIRKAEAGFMYRRWAAAQATLAEASDLLATAEAAVAAATSLAARAATAQAETAATLPDLRSAEATAAAALHRLEVASDEIDAEERRLAEATAAAEAQRMEIESDRSREGARLAEAQSTLVGLEKESAGLALEQAGQDSELSATATALEIARQAAAETEQALTTRTEQVASDEARRGALERVKIDLTLRLATLGERLAAVATEKAVITARLSESTALAEAQATLETAREISAEARGAFDAAHATTQTTELARSTTEAAERAARDALREAEIARERCVAETSALNAMLTADQATGAGPVVDDMVVPTDLALALAAALGDDLLASTDAQAPAHWRTLAAGDDPAPPLPDGVPALSTLIEAPAALHRRLDQIGLVERGGGADRQAELRQGQRLVSREGDLWRWDGFTAGADAHGGAAARLRQRQRLDSLNKIISRLDEELAATRHALAEASGQLSAAGNAYRGAREAEIAAHEAAHAADQALDNARESYEAATKAVAEDRSRSAALEDATERLTNDHAEGTRGHTDTVEALAAVPSTEDLRRPLDVLKQEMAARRAELDERFRGHESLKRGVELRAARRA